MLGWCVHLLVGHTRFGLGASVTLEKLWSTWHWRACPLTSVPVLGSVAVPLWLSSPSSTESTCMWCFACGVWRQQASPLPAHPEILQQDNLLDVFGSPATSYHQPLQTVWPYQQPRPWKESHVRSLHGLLLPLQGSLLPEPYGSGASVKLHFHWLEQFTKICTYTHTHICIHAYAHTHPYFPQKIYTELWKLDSWVYYFALYQWCIRVSVVPYPYQYLAVLISAIMVYVRGSSFFFKFYLLEI